jgi:hypothetical protein
MANAEQYCTSLSLNPIFGIGNTGGDIFHQKGKAPHNADFCHINSGCHSQEKTQQHQDQLTEEWVFHQHQLEVLAQRRFPSFLRIMFGLYSTAQSLPLALFFLDTMAHTSQAW